MTRHGYVTLATNDTYCLGALVMCQSLRNVGTSVDIVALVTDQVSPKMSHLMKDSFDEVKLVDIVKGRWVFA